jgi:hypothetical protein
VARSYSFYRSGHTKPEDGVVNLALGLGKSIVDGGLVWSYSPRFPKASPPFGAVAELIEQTQAEFWAVNMGKPPAYDPTAEAEYLVKAGLPEAESDDTLRLVASTYDPASDRLAPGIFALGPRVVNFAPILVHEALPLNAAVRKLMADCEASLGEKVEIEFAVTLPRDRDDACRLGFLQVRPLVVSQSFVEVSEADLEAEDNLLASDNVMGNGEAEGVRDVVYVRPGGFEARASRLIVEQIAAINDRLLAETRPYLLIGFGRWGSSDPSLGIPVNWGQICGSRAIVEATLPKMNVDLSQGTHFFHNISSFEVSYFCVRHDGPYPLDWEWLDRRPAVAETELVRHVRLEAPLTIRVDGRTGRGVVRSRNRS